LKGVTPIQEDSPDRDPAGKFDDEDYPAYSMGHAAEILGVTQAFLRSLDAAKLLTPVCCRVVPLHPTVKQPRHWVPVTVWTRCGTGRCRQGCA